MDCSPARTKDPSQWLQTCPDFSQPLAEQLVEWFLTWESDLTESVKWNNLCFSGRKLVCGIAACKQHVSLFFFRGTELPDPEGLLVGTGKRARHITIQQMADLENPAIETLLRAALRQHQEASL